MVKLKRAAVVDFLKYLSEIFTSQQIEQVKAVLSAEDIAECFGLQSGQWISFQSIVNLNLAIDRILGQGDFKLIAQLNQMTSERNFNGLYKGLLSFMPSRLMFNKMPLIWRQQISHGKCQIVWKQENLVEIVVTNWDPPKYHELLQIPYHQTAAKFVGWKNIDIYHPQCIARGDQQCVFSYENLML